MKSALALTAALLALSGCADRGEVKLQTADEIYCGQQATAFVTRQFQDVEFREDGAPAGHDAPFMAWSVVLDRCLKQRAVY